MNFNTDPQLFANLAKTILATDPPLRCACRIKEGHVIFKGDVIARFTNSTDAQSVLLNSGFAQIDRDGEVVYSPLA